MSDAEKWVTLVVYFTNGIRGEWIVTEERSQTVASRFKQCVTEGFKITTSLHIPHQRGSLLLRLSDRIDAITIYEIPAP